MKRRVGAIRAHGATVERWGAVTTLEAAQGQIDGFLSQLPSKRHQNQVASVED